MPKKLAHFQTTAAAERFTQAVAAGAETAPFQVLTGMGGVGKTQLAAHQARVLRDAGQLDLLVWVTAATRTDVVDAYAHAASQVLGCDQGAPDRSAASFLAWLEPKPGADRCRWMIVLDDLADPADLRQLWPPTSPHGRTVLTTRRRDAALAGADWRHVPVDLFTTAEAVTYLTATLAAHDRHDRPDELAALAEDVDHLPLALSQSAAYLIDSGLDCASYRTLLADHTVALDASLPDRLRDDQTTPVTSAWSVCLDRADQLRPVGLARRMLRLIAMLDPNGIPEAVLTGEAARQHLAAHTADRSRLASSPFRSRSPRRDVSEQQAREALRALHRLGLIDHDPENPHETVRVHRLVQRAVRETRTAHRRDLLARTAADALMASWSRSYFDTALSRTLRANTAALTAHAEHALHKDSTHRVLFEAGHSLAASGQDAAAVDHFRHLASAAHNRFDRLDAQQDLAWQLGWTVDPATAVATLKKVRRSRVWVCGLTEPETLGSWHSLAVLRGRAGDVAGAVKSLKRVLRLKRWILGSSHPQTLDTRHEFAWWTGKAGDPAAAVAMFTTLVTDRERVQGIDSYDALASRYALAWWTGKAGDPATAVAALRELLGRFERIADSDHPDLLDLRHGLARWRGEAGDTAGAAEALASVARDQERVLGPEADDTRRTLRALARWRGEAGLTDTRAPTEP
ncbi:tetratricopeptide repeat protein [Streptomyces alboflavus]|uniref:tetratricopeptide repeat protein n=1 Tax=Streptomyces alboflavus TaxID=67267 RepID=UPI00068C31C4|nr:tetratricopeptide repeat protein [Streptomyces alboflavus]